MRVGLLDEKGKRIEEATRKKLEEINTLSLAENTTDSQRAEVLADSGCVLKPGQR